MRNSPLGKGRNAEGVGVVLECRKAREEGGPIREIRRCAEVLRLEDNPLAVPLNLTDFNAAV